MLLSAIFSRAHELQRRRPQHHQVADERHERVDEQRLADAEELEQPRHDEHLQQEPEQVHRAEQLAVGLADEPLARGRRVGAGAVDRVRLLDDVAAEQVLARRVDDVEQDDQRRDERQVAVLANQLEPALLAQRLVGGGRDRRAGSRAALATRLTSARAATQTTRMHAGADQQAGGPARLDELARPHRPDPRAEAAADADRAGRSACPAPA